MSDRTILHVLPHTHWDREWYEPFHGYRQRLVRVVDSLLALLEAQPDFHFHFDGQSAAIEDYLSLRPQAEDRVRALVESGRLAVGPWRILMDEFLCSPETIIRNLRQGLATAERLGADPKIGYIPDSFGHIAQMPQVLALAGMEAALVWRGVPAHVDRPLFAWEAPDGTTLTTMYLATSYSNGATLPETFEDLMVRAKRIVEDLTPFRPAASVLAMCGSDHLGPQAHLSALFADANTRQNDIEFRIGSLHDYFASQPKEEWPRWQGEMRSSARANLLMGVLSARMPLKQAEARASAALERYAEPLVSLSGFDPGLVLDEAWRALVENSAHDSVCGCGIDDVADDVAHRYRHTERVARLVAKGALETLSEQVAFDGETEGVLLYNPSPFVRSGVVEATMPLPAAAELLRIGGNRVQTLEESEQVVVDMTITGAQLAKIVPTIHSRKMGDLWVNAMRLEPGRIRTVTLSLAPIEAGRFDVEKAKREVEAAAIASPRGKFRVLGRGPSLVRLLLDAPEVPGLGWTAVAPVAADDDDAAPSKVHASQTRIDNGLVAVEAHDDGTVSITHLGTGVVYRKIGLIDVADAGDEYTYAPPVKDTVVDAPHRCQISVTSGALQAELQIAGSWRLPSALTSDRRKRASGRVTVDVTTTWSLRAGEPFARLDVRIMNTARDHRLRLRIPLPFTSTGSDADGAFGVQHRGLTAEGATHEHPTPAFPARRWVDVSDGGQGISVFHRGTPEYEITDAGNTLEVTLLRCVGWLSRQDCSTRSGPAGPMLPAPGAQLPGEHTFALALYPHEGDWEVSDAGRVAESFVYPMLHTSIRAQKGTLATAGTGIQIEPAAVWLSAAERRGSDIDIRIYNSSSEAIDARITVGSLLTFSHATLVDLRGTTIRSTAQDDADVMVALRPKQIATVRLIDAVSSAPSA